jgi:hypothetical protein
MSRLTLDEARAPAAPARQQRLCVRPVSFRGAVGFVATHHRHRTRPPIGHVFTLGVFDDRGLLCGVAIVGRPVARHLDDGETLEVTRLATDGCPNACSALYGAARRYSLRAGYRRLVTYTLQSEPGASLRAAGWREVARLRARKGWGCQSRPRGDLWTDGRPKIRWEAP